MYITNITAFWLLQKSYSAFQGCVLSGLSSLLTQISGLAPTLSTFVVIVATAVYVVFEGTNLKMVPIFRGDEDYYSLIWLF